MNNCFRYPILVFIFIHVFFTRVTSQNISPLITIISDSLLKTHISALAHDSMMGRLTGSRGAGLASLYIANQMRQIGLQPLPEQDSSFFVPWIKYPGEKRLDTFNVAGILYGHTFPDTLIVFSAHFDHIGLQSEQKSLPFGRASKRIKGDSVYNGANDNASGVAAMLALARAFANTGSAYSLLFVTFSGEELGLRGSARFVPYLNPQTVKQNINLEMLGRPDKRAPFITEDGSDAFRKMLNKTLYFSHPDFGKQYFWPDSYTEQKLFERSDNISFHNAGISANTIMGTSPYDRYYHSAGDEATTIDIVAMRRIVEAIYFALIPLVKAEQDFL